MTYTTSMQRNYLRIKVIKLFMIPVDTICLDFKTSIQINIPVFDMRNGISDRGGNFQEFPFHFTMDFRWNWLICLLKSD